MLFSKFYAAKSAKRANAATHVLRDTHTHNEIARGTYADMQALQSAFGVSYIETV